MSDNAFHEKAGRSQVGSFVFSLVLRWSVCLGNPMSSLPLKRHEAANNREKWNNESGTEGALEAPKRPKSV
jgi:hypothetical protein